MRYSHLSREAVCDATGCAAKSTRQLVSPLSVLRTYLFPPRGTVGSRRRWQFSRWPDRTLICPHGNGMRNQIVTFLLMRNQIVTTLPLHAPHAHPVKNVPSVPPCYYYSIHTRSFLPTRPTGQGYGENHVEPTSKRVEIRSSSRRTKHLSRHCKGVPPESLVG